MVTRKHLYRFQPLFAGYIHARICSLIDKARIRPENCLQTVTAAGEPLVTTREWQLWTALSGYGDTVAEAAEKNEPFLMTPRLLSIAQSYNSL